MVGGREVSCAVAVPESSTSHSAGVILVHDIFGLTDVTRGHAVRLAEAGYTVIAPDLHSSGGSFLSCVFTTMRDFRRRAGTSWEILNTARTTLIETYGVDPERVGVMGFCMGGGFALLLALRADLSVAAPFYGEAPPEVLESHDLCPVVGGWGNRDRLFRRHGQRLEEHLAAEGVDHDITLYPGVGHSYMDDHPGLLARLGRYSPLRAAYDPAAADDSWRRVLAFFETHL
ncbi:MAG: dienelactone hydrolase family protein [Acidimicrobiales bacterium]